MAIIMDAPIIPNLKQLIESFTIAVTPAPDQGQYQIQITTDQQAIMVAMEMLKLLLGSSDRIARVVANTASQEQADRRVQLLRFQQEGVAKLYWEYRQLGLKHRQAIDKVVKSDVAKQIRCSKADVWHYVKVYNHYKQVEEVEDARQQAGIEQQQRIARGDGHEAVSADH